MSVHEVDPGLVDERVGESPVGWRNGIAPVAGETGRPGDHRAAGSSVSPQQRISPSKESRTTQIGNPKPQENGIYSRLSCKIDHLLRSNHRARSIGSEFFTDDYLARLHTASAFVPVEVAGLVYRISSAVSEIITLFIM
jgi:hypothetical protein